MWRKTVRRLSRGPGRIFQNTYVKAISHYPAMPVAARRLYKLQPEEKWFGTIKQSSDVPELRWSLGRSGPGGSDPCAAGSKQGRIFVVASFLSQVGGQTSASSLVSRSRALEAPGCLKGCCGNLLPILLDQVGKVTPRDKG